MTQPEPATARRAVYQRSVQKNTGKQQRGPKSALCNITGRFIELISQQCSNIESSGRFISTCSVPHCQSRPIAAPQRKLSLGPRKPRLPDLPTIVILSFQRLKARFPIPVSLPCVFRTNWIDLFKSKLLINIKHQMKDTASPSSCSSVHRSNASSSKSVMILRACRTCLPRSDRYIGHRFNAHGVFATEET